MSRLLALLLLVTLSLSPAKPRRFDIDSAAQYLGVPTSRLRRWVKLGRIPVVKFDGPKSRGQLVGLVRIDNGRLIADPPLQGVVDAWLSARRSAADFVAKYRDWSNGYVTSKQIEPEVQQAIFSDDHGRLVPREQATRIELIFADGTNLLAVVTDRGADKATQ